MLHIQKCRLFAIPRPIFLPHILAAFMQIIYSQYRRGTKSGSSAAQVSSLSVLSLSALCTARVAWGLEQSAVPQSQGGRGQQPGQYLGEQIPSPAQRHRYCTCCFLLTAPRSCERFLLRRRTAPCSRGQPDGLGARPPPRPAERHRRGGGGGGGGEEEDDAGGCCCQGLV